MLAVYSWQYTAIYKMMFSSHLLTSSCVYINNVTTSDVSYVRRCNALITFGIDIILPTDYIRTIVRRQYNIYAFGNYYHLYQLQTRYWHFHHFDLLYVINLMSHFVLTNSFCVHIISNMLYVSEEKICLSLSATIITCIIVNNHQ